MVHHVWINSHEIFFFMNSYLSMVILNWLECFNYSRIDTHWIISEQIVSPFTVTSLSRRNDWPAIGETYLLVRGRFSYQLCGWCWIKDPFIFQNRRSIVGCLFVTVLSLGGILSWFCRMFDPRTPSKHREASGTRFVAIGNLLNYSSIAA